MGFITGRSKRAERYAFEGFNYLKNSPVAQNFLSQGVAGNDILRTGYADPGVGANRAIAGLLGVGGDPEAANAAFRNYLGSSGYNFRLNEGLRAITGNQAASGLLNSGATLKALNKYGQELASSEFQNYLGQLGGLSASGLGAAGQLAQGGLSTLQTIGSAGTSGGANAAQYTGDQGSGLFGTIVGSVLGAFSDARLKKNIQHWATDKHGIKWYHYEWTDEAKEKYDMPDGKQVGVMAQDLVGTKYANAVGERDGYRTVHYWMLPTDEVEAEAA